MASNTLVLATGDEDWWVVTDTSGKVIYRKINLKTGWRLREEAEHEASGLQSRTVERVFVKNLQHQ